MRIVTFTSLFPNPEMPQRGIFVENRLRHLLAHSPVESRVISPIPQVPLGLVRSGDYARFARVPPRGERHGIAAQYPRYMHIPKIGMWLQPFAMARAALPAFQALQADGYDFDLIDAHYFYPDGVAAVWLGRQLGKPVVITARGSDLNVLPRHALPRRMIRRAAAQAAGLITVSAALRDVLTELGVAPGRVRVLRNGVDLARFTPPTDYSLLRAQLGLTGPTLLSVGNLVEAKGHHWAIEALAELPGVDLAIAGDGPYRGELERLGARLGLGGRVRFLGSLPQNRLRDWYGAADALVLASRREGWANVLLEAMACGTPVLATPVGGTPELVTAPAAGRLLADHSARAVAQAAAELLANPPDRTATRAFAEQFGWQPTTDGQVALFERILSTR